MTDHMQSGPSLLLLLRQPAEAVLVDFIVTCSELVVNSLPLLIILYLDITGRVICQENFLINYSCQPRLTWLEDSVCGL
jgi:hypothetical protein